MPLVTIGFGMVLTALGLFAYLGSATANPSVTALIPTFIGGPLVLCGLVAQEARRRMHAMHVAVMLGLIGAIAALGRGLSKISVLTSDEPGVDKRPIAFVLLTGAVCAVYVVLCVRSFILARRRRDAEAKLHSA